MRLRSSRVIPDPFVPVEPRADLRLSLNEDQPLKPEDFECFEPAGDCVRSRPLKVLWLGGSPLEGFRARSFSARLSAQSSRPLS